MSLGPPLFAFAMMCFDLSQTPAVHTGREQLETWDLSRTPPWTTLLECTFLNICLMAFTFEYSHVDGVLRSAMSTRELTLVMWLCKTNRSILYRTKMDT